jgi:hypothetical protein
VYISSGFVWINIYINIFTIVFWSLWLYKTFFICKEHSLIYWHAFFGCQRTNPSSNIFYVIVFFLSLNINTNSCVNFTQILFELSNTRFLWNVTQEFLECTFDTSPTSRSKDIEFYTWGEIRELTIDDTHSIRMAWFFFEIVFYVLKAYF